MPADLEPEKLVATAVYGATLYASRDVRRLQPAHGRALLRAALGLRERGPPGLLRGRLEDARLRGRRAARLAAPNAVVAPIASGAMYSKIRQGFGSCWSWGSSRARQPRITAGRPRAAPRSRPPSPRGDPVAPVRPQTEGALVGDREPSRRRRPPWAAARESGGAVHGIPEGEIGENMTLLAENTGVFGETAAGVALGALREAVRRGELGAGRRGRAPRHGRRSEDAPARG